MAVGGGTRAADDWGGGGAGVDEGAEVFGARPAVVDDGAGVVGGDGAALVDGATFVDGVALVDGMAGAAAGGESEDGTVGAVCGGMLSVGGAVARVSERDVASAAVGGFSRVGGRSTGALGLGVGRVPTDGGAVATLGARAARRALRHPVCWVHATNVAVTARTSDVTATAVAIRSRRRSRSRCRRMMSTSVRSIAKSSGGGAGGSGGNVFAMATTMLHSRVSRIPPGGSSPGCEGSATGPRRAP